VFFTKTASENPILWTGMNDASAKGRKGLGQMLKQVQHDGGVSLSCFVIPNLFRDLGFGLRNLGSKALPCGRGSLLYISEFS